MNEELIENLYAWVDQIPLSRPKRDLKRDFSDGVMVAEVVKHFFPNYVELHNYPPALGINKKIVNWNMLNRKVFRKLKFEISDDVIRSIVSCQPNAIEQLLLLLRCKIENLKTSDSVGDIQDGCNNDQNGIYNDNNHQSMHQTDYNFNYDLKFTLSQKERENSNLEIKTNSVSNIPICSTNTTNNSKCSRDESTFSNIGKFNNNSVKNVKNHNNGKNPNSLIAKKQIEGSHFHILIHEKDTQIKAQEETIEILNAKLRKMENLLQLKELRIEDLQNQINEIRKK